MIPRLAVIPALVLLIAGTTRPAAAQTGQSSSESAAAAGTIDYRLLATSKTSTMQKELNAAAEEGFRFGAFMGGNTAFGGSEAVAVMTRRPGDHGRWAYKLLATSKTSTMQRELQEASDDGYEYRAQSVFDTMFGGREVVLVLERDKDAPHAEFEYRLLATSRTSTMQKELSAAGRDGFDLVGMTVADTALGGNEVVAITKRPVDGRR